MSIESFMIGGIREFAFRNYPVSMACACIALDATANRELGGGVGDRCKKFVNKYLDIISAVGTGGGILAVPGSTLCIADPRNPGSPAPVQDIIYYSIRNCLIHEAGLAANVAFTERAFLGIESGTFHISTRFIVAILLSVAASPVHAGVKIDEDLQIILDSRAIPFNSLIGNAAAVRAFLSLP